MGQAKRDAEEHEERGAERADQHEQLAEAPDASAESHHVRGNRTTVSA